MPDIGLDKIVDYEDDGTPVTMADVLAATAEIAKSNGMKLVIEDDPNEPNNPFYKVVPDDD
jgi:hypothetical protein